MPPPVDPLAPFSRVLRWTRAGMVGERLARAFWPLASLAAVGYAAAVFDLLRGAWPVWGLGLALVMALALALGLWRFRWPSHAEAVARLDRTLPGRPLAALSDDLAIGAQDPAARALWAAHLGRLTARAGEARWVRPDPALPRRDPFALRLIAGTALSVALIFGGAARLDPTSALPGTAGAAIGPSWEGWVVPPPYTARPTIYLNEVERASFQVPQGARVVVRFYGQAGALSLRQALGGDVQADDSGQALEFAAMRSGELAIEGPRGRVWQVVVLPDAPPTVSFTGPVGRARGGVMEVPFSAADDHGITLGEAVITLDLPVVERVHGLTPAPEPRDPLRLTLPMPVSGSRADFVERLREDLSDHPWAHLPVRIVLQVTDAAGQTGSTELRPALLPARRFFQPAALAVTELRRDLLWSRENARRSAQLMRAMLYRPGDGLPPQAHERLKAVVDLIEARLDTGSLDPETRDQAAGLLWDLALFLEEGELANARERLRRAQERLDEAMRSGADPNEIADLMDELRDATREFMRMLAEQAQPEPGTGDRRDMGEGERQQITGNQIQELMDEIQRLMEEGRMDEAAALMAQLNALLENLQITQGEGGEPMPGDQAMQGLGDTLGRQQGLADETFRELQERFNRGETGQGGDGLDELAQRQRELAEALREQQLGDLPGEGTPEGDAALDALEDAQRAMEDAARDLAEGNARGALERQAQAMDALREGLRQLADAQRLDQAERNDPQAGQGQAQGRDPLGRDSGDSARGAEGGTALPGDDPRARARDLLDEIRRRSAERQRSEAERDYLNRLIDRF